MSKHKPTCIDWNALGGEGWECDLDCPMKVKDDTVGAVYDSFDEYVKVYDDGETFREWLAGIVGGDPARFVVLLPSRSTSPHSLLPGGYTAAWVGRYEEEMVGGKPKKHRYSKTPWYVHINDCDDNSMKRHFESEEAAQAALKELKTHTPFYLYDLDAYGYVAD